MCINVHPPVCRVSWFLYTLNIYAHFSSHFSQQLLMAEIWYLVTSFIYVPHIVGSVFGPNRFLLPVCRLCWFLYTLKIQYQQNIRSLPSIVAEKNVTKNEHICSMCIKINKVGKQEVGIWWVQKRFPWYGVPIWSLWPNIKFLPSIVAEKNVTKNVYFIEATYLLYLRSPKGEGGILFYLCPSVIPSVQDIFHHIFLSNWPLDAL
jgi:hypothetical protein